MKAYDALLCELTPWLRGYFYRRLPREQVDDAVHDALLALHANRHGYTASRPFGPWISAIARYKWIDAVRHAGRFKLAELSENLAVSDHGNAVTSAVVVEELLGRLKDRQADVIRLVKLEGATIEAAAKLTGQSEALVKVNIHRGMRKLTTFVV